jgi:hypothetical protein
MFMCFAAVCDSFPISTDIRRNEAGIGRMSARGPGASQHSMLQCGLQERAPLHSPHLEQGANRELLRFRIHAAVTPVSWFRRFLTVFMCFRVFP